METSALNVAHERQRRAEALLKERRFEEAAECHEKVASLLEEVRAQIENNLVDLRTSSTSSQGSGFFVNSLCSLVTRESLILQRDYHERQAAVVRMKQVQYEEYKASLEIQQRDLLGKQVNNQLEKPSSDVLVPEKIEGSLRHAIYKTIAEQDSLLVGLLSLPETDSQYFKHPKDSGVIIEELRCVNGQLRSLVESLLLELDSKEKEVRHLNEKLRAVSISPNEESSPEDPNSLDLASLPPLVPLDMPLFDFTSS
ncbi:nuclear receptor-binding factor 2 isoform X2 [Cephus cinctus]|uniref:Nuclear receptor-binding factor 2 isoform X2 n=1 Tax=Cephus cinctus TaxID=211228 RepID=A0AAJ7C3K3_CEPCN|nr:nuclear receptor-binding factor 2 isoform X2 [Cephus cinctus]